MTRSHRGAVSRRRQRQGRRRARCRRTRQLIDEVRLALEEALGVKRVAPVVNGVVEVVAILVRQGPHERPKAHDPPLHRGAHPHLEPSAVGPGAVAAVQLTVGVTGPGLVDLHAGPRHPEPVAQHVQQPLAARLHRRLGFRREALADPFHPRHEILAVGDRHGVDRVAGVVEHLVTATRARA